MMLQPHPPHHRSSLSRWLPAALAMLFLLASLDLYQRVEQGDLFPGPAEETAVVSVEAPAPGSAEAHSLTAEMALPGGEILAIDQHGLGYDATLSLVVLERGGQSARVLFRGSPGQGLLGGVYDGGRRFHVQGSGGVYHIDTHEGLVGWTRLPEGGTLEDLEAGMAVVRMDRPDGTSHFYVYRGEELRHEFHLSGRALAARLSPDGRTFGVLMPGRLRLVPLASTAMPLDLPLDYPVRPDLIVSDSGSHALVVREDGVGVGLASPTGMSWFPVALPWPDQPLEAGVAELDPAAGRFAITDGQHIYVGAQGTASLEEVATASTEGDRLHLGEWTFGQGLLFTVQRGGVTSDGMYFLDPETGDYRSFGVTEACVPSLEAPAMCGGEAASSR